MFKDIKPQSEESIMESEESPMPQNRKYFGMTTTQLAILARFGGCCLPGICSGRLPDP